MKIAVITSLYKPFSKGGAEQVVENIATGLVGDGHEVIIITSKPPRLDRGAQLAEYGSVIPTDPERPRNLRGSGGGVEGSLLISAHSDLRIIRFFPCNLFWFGNIDKKPAWLRLPWHIIDTLNFYSYFKMKRILTREKPDLVMTHNLKGIGYTVTMAIRHTGIKHIHTIHDVQLVEPSGLIFAPSVETQNFASLRRPGQTVYSWITKKLFGSPDIVISPSTWLLKFYIEKGFFPHSKKVILKNPAGHAVRGRKETSASHVSSPNNHSRADINLLYIGQIEKHKGILFLINAIKSLKTAAKVQLNIIGKGSQTENLKNQIKNIENIKYHGYVKNEALNTFFIQTDFLVVPSLCYENAPTVIHESFSFATPVLASDIGGIPELLKEGYNGYIFEAGNEKSLTTAILKAISLKNNLEQMRAHAIDSIKDQGIKNYLQKILSL